MKQMQSHIVHQHALLHFYIIADLHRRSTERSAMKLFQSNFACQHLHMKSNRRKVTSNIDIHICNNMSLSSYFVDRQLPDGTENLAELNRHWHPHLILYSDNQICAETVAVRSAVEPFKGFIVLRRSHLQCCIEIYIVDWQQEMLCKHLNAASHKRSAMNLLQSYITDKQFDLQVNRCRATSYIDMFDHSRSVEWGRVSSDICIIHEREQLWCFI